MPQTLRLDPGAVIPTGNDFVSFPSIRADDGALNDFNVLSMEHKGLLEASGPKGKALITPWASFNKKPLAFKGLSWELRGYWIPTATLQSKDLTLKLTYCAPNGARGAFIRMVASNRSSKQSNVELGLRVQWSALKRVIYAATELGGTRSISPGPWVADAVVYTQKSDRTLFSWCLQCRGGKWDKQGISKTLKLKAGETQEAGFFLGVGPEEFSASNSAKTLGDRCDRHGSEAVVAEFEAWCEARSRKLSEPRFETLMNRNFMFNRFFAWGRTLDSEQLVSVTSRSPRYYVCAAYWDRDAIIWSFPSLLDTDLDFAREALEHALGIQLRNTGRHSRFIDGTMLEDGFQLDEACAPIIAFNDYVKASGDRAFLSKHAAALDTLEAGLMARYVEETGLFSTHEDSQDEYVKEIYFTYANAMVWKALMALSELRRSPRHAALAAKLKKKILEHCVDAERGIFRRATDLKHHLFNDVPPGSLLRLPAIGFIKESDPVFAKTYEWLHSDGYEWSQKGLPWGLPTSHRLPFTSIWAVADRLRLDRGRKRAVEFLDKTQWDHGIFCEGIDPRTAEAMGGGSAFATVAGYMSHCIYETFKPKKSR